MVGHHTWCLSNPWSWDLPSLTVWPSMTILGWLLHQHRNPFLWWLNRWSYRWYDKWSRIIVESVLLFSFNDVVLISTDVIKLASHDVPRFDSRDEMGLQESGQYSLSQTYKIWLFLSTVNIWGPSWDSTWEAGETTWNHSRRPHLVATKSRFSASTLATNVVVLDSFLPLVWEGCKEATAVSRIPSKETSNRCWKPS